MRAPDWKGWAFNLTVEAGALAKLEMSRRNGEEEEELGED